MEFKLEGKEFIELNRVIKYIAWAESGGEANKLIGASLLQVNGNIELRKRNKLRVGDVIKYKNQECTIVA